MCKILTLLQQRSGQHSTTRYMRTYYLLVMNTTVAKALQSLPNHKSSLTLAQNLLDKHSIQTN